MMGRSGSPSSNATRTSQPTRGRMNGPLPVPVPAPAQGEATRIQQLDDPPPGAGSPGSQGNFTLTRPYLSVWIASPGGATTTAVSNPAITGFGVTRGGRYGRPDGMQVNSLR